MRVCIAWLAPGRMDGHSNMRNQLRWVRGLGSSLHLRNLAVLTALGGIGWCGHISHWSLPKFSRSASAPSAAAAAKVAEPTDQRAHARSEEFSTASALPTVEFVSASAARNCGVECGTAQSQPIKHFVSAHGVVAYDQTRLAQLSVRVPGIVWRVEKRLGDTVQSGDVLVIVDSAEVGQAKASLLEAAATHRLDAQNVERMEKIQDVIAHREVLAAKAAEDVSRTKLLNAVQRLRTMGFPIEVGDIAGLSTEALSKRLHGLGLPAPYDHDAPSANLIPLMAPFSGIVTSCDLVRGETVDPTEPQYVIADINRLWLNLAVRGEDVPKLRVGAPVEFATEGDQRPIVCTLTWIGTEIDARTRTVRARAEGENPPIDRGEPDYDSRRRLRVGTYGTARIITRNEPATVTVPNDALRWQWEIGRELVFVPSQDGREFTPRIVTRGRVQDGNVQIVAGLAPGERIVTRGSRILSSELSELLRRHPASEVTQAREFKGPAGVLAATAAGE
ncbi:MAG TPA: efflux RND transporter periplasmic adaptor subunit [Pirellulales bacterium]|nr:efflux RND transporter periplasmic adaptor subunit [Pirellulales bacterium]